MRMRKGRMKLLTVVLELWKGNDEMAETMRMEARSDRSVGRFSPFH